MSSLQSIACCVRSTCLLGTRVAAIIAREMIEDETMLALELALPDGDRPPLVWIESSLNLAPPSAPCAGRRSRLL